jgi:hypothetical protein
MRKVLQGSCVSPVVLTAALLFTFGIVLRMPAAVNTEDDVVFNIRSSKTSYITGDTVLLAVKIKIRPHYYLYGNPVGPGGGRPLTVAIQQKCPDIRWVAVKKLKAEKVGPPFGDWVWVYRNETVLFCVGVVVLHNKTGTISTGVSIRLEGLLCRESCRLQAFVLPCSIDIAPRSYTVGQFANDPDLLYIASTPMADFDNNEH